MSTLHRLFPLLLLAFSFGCGPGQHEVGKDPHQTPPDAGNTATACTSTSCGQNQVCDFDGACRDYCGPNYPGVTCRQGTACDSYICREVCNATSGCGTGATCQQAS